jgi:hypothetical protein
MTAKVPYTQIVAEDGDDPLERWPAELRSKLLAEFFFDVDLIVGFMATRAKFTLGLSCLACIVPIYGLALVPSFLANACTVRRNQLERTRSLRIGLTKDELIFFQGQYGGLCRCRCQQNGAKSTIVPLNRVTDVVINLPAGGCCPPNVISTVEVQTAGQGSALSSSEIKLEGLFDPDHFRRVLLALRHGDALPEPADPRSARIYRQVCEIEPGKTRNHVTEPDTSLTAVSPVPVPHGRYDDTAATRAQIEAVTVLRQVQAEMQQVNENLSAMRAMMEKKNVSLVDL